MFMPNSFNIINTFPDPNEWGMNWPSILLTMMMFLMNQSGCSWNEWQLIIMFISFNITNTIPGPNEWGMNWSSMLLTMMSFLNHQSGSSWNEWQLIIMFMSFNIINTFHRFKWVRDELIFNASDNDDVPEWPILLLMEWMTINNHAQVIQYLNAFPGSNEWGMNWPSILLIMMMLLMNQCC